MSVCLLYYSSLFYAMDVGEAKGEHGGFHEAAIGIGIFVGPATSAAALWFFPQTPNLGVWLVGGLMLIGGGIILKIRIKTEVQE